MKAYSLDLRHRILAASQQGSSDREVAERFGVSVDTVQRYKRRFRETGNLVPKPLPGRVCHIKGEEEPEFRALVASRNDWTLDTLGHAWQERKGIKPSVSVLSATCKRFKITYKKRAASPRNET